MRKALSLFLSVIQVASGTITSDEACRYIGAKLAKTQSTCDMQTGLCVGIGKEEESEMIVDNSSRMQRLSCDNAISLAREMIPSFVSEAVRHNLYTFMVAVVKPSLLKHERVHAGLLQSIFDATNGFYNTETRMPPNPFIGELNGLLQLLVEQLVISPHAFDVDTDIWFLYFDLVSVIPEIKLFPASELRPATRMLSTRRPSYREPYQNEYIVDPSLGDVVYLAKAIDSLALKASKQKPISDDELEAVDKVLASNGQNSLASHSMLIHMIRRGLCPRIDRVINLFEVYTEVSVAVKLGVSLVSVCHDWAPYEVRLAASVALGYLKEWIPRDIYMTADSMEAATVEFLSDDRLPWISAFGEASRSHSLVMRDQLLSFGSGTIRWNRIDSFTWNSVFMVERQAERISDFPSFARGIGRVLGYCIREQANLTRLKLHPLVVELLKSPSSHPSQLPMDRVFPIPECPREPSLEEFLQTNLYVRRGIVDTLGPAAFELFTASEFRAIFIE